MADAALDRMRAEVEASPKGRRPRILLAYDGERIAAYDTSPRFDEEPLRVGLDMLSLEGDVFFPLGGHERYVPKKERMADVRATRFISRRKARRSTVLFAACAMMPVRVGVLETLLVFFLNMVRILPCWPSLAACLVLLVRRRAFVRDRFVRCVVTWRFVTASW